MFEKEQLTSGSKGCSFYKALFLLAKGVNDISFIFTLSRGNNSLQVQRGAVSTKHLGEKSK